MWHCRAPSCPHPRKQHVCPCGVHITCWEINPDSSLSLVFHIQFLSSAVDSTSKHVLKSSVFLCLSCCHVSGGHWHCSPDATPAPCVDLTVPPHPMLSPFWDLISCPFSGGPRGFVWEHLVLLWVMVDSANRDLPPNLVGIFLRLEGRGFFRESKRLNSGLRAWRSWRNAPSIIDY